MTAPHASLSHGPAVGAAVDTSDVVALRPVALAAALGVGGGVCYSLSPVTAWLLVALALVVCWAAIGVQGRERRVLLGVLGCSIALRLAAIAVLAWRVNPQAETFTTVFGDGVYALRRALWIRNVFASVPIAPPDFIEAFNSYGQSGYHVVLAWLQALLGPAPFGAHVLSVVLYLLGAVALYRVARTAFGGDAALLGLAIVLFLPTLFLWSISPLKESVYFCLTALVTVAPVYALRSKTTIVRIGCVVAVPFLLAGVSALRAGGLAIATGGIVVGVMSAMVVRSRRLTLCAAILAPLLLLAAARRPRVQDEFMAQVRRSAGVHLGHVRTPGASYKLLDLDFYYSDRSLASLTPDDGVRYVSMSLAEFVLEPRPWAAKSTSERFMAVQQVVWYALAVLAPIGLFAGVRRDSLLTMLLACNALVGAAVIAPNSGNIGTLIRHRDMIVPFVVWLSSLGAVSVCSRLMVRKETRQKEQPNGFH